MKTCPYSLIVLFTLLTALVSASSPISCFGRRPQPPDLKLVTADRQEEVAEGITATDEAGTTALRAAVDDQELETVQQLLAKGANVEAKASDGSTPLLGAVLTKNVALVKLLLDKGADVRAKLPNGTSALTWAGLMDDKEIINLLLSNGAEMTLHAGAMIGDANEIQRLIDGGADVNEKQGEGWTSLMWAARKGHVAAVKLLVQKGAHVSEQREGGNTALMDAVIGGKVEVVRVLLDSFTETDRNKQDLLPVFRSAAISGRADIAGLLLSAGSDLGNRAAHDKNLVLEVVRWGSEDMLKLIADIGADLHSGTRIGAPIIHAGIHGRTEAVRVLLDRGADVNAVAAYGRRTVLMNAARDGYLDIVRLLADGGAVLDARDGMGNTALGEAAENGHSEIVRLLLRKGAGVNGDKYPSTVPGVEAGGQGDATAPRWLRQNDTPLVRASRNSDVEAVRLLLENGATGGGVGAALHGRHLAVVEILLAGNVDSNDWSVALVQYAYKGNLRLVQWWLKKDEELFQGREETRGHGPEETLFPALYFAAAGGHAEIVKLLLSKAAFLVNVQADDGTTVVMKAASRAPTALVKLILEHGPDLNIKDKRGRTALDHAEHRGDADIIELLKSHKAVNGSSATLP
ncbi:MAG: ankyrin repeat domain-containing protein [Pseudomonadota bacterium]